MFLGMRFLSILPLVLLLPMCASSTPPSLPRPDPVRDEITILQKQLLELQAVQNETKSRLDESRASFDRLSARLKALEERSALKDRPASEPKLTSGNPATATMPKAAVQKKKKTPKKAKNKTRRQE